jgi:hypothetical protein
MNVYKFSLDSSHKYAAGELIVGARSKAEAIACIQNKIPRAKIESGYFSQVSDWSPDPEKLPHLTYTGKRAKIITGIVYIE